MTSTLFRGLDDAFFYLTTPHGVTPLRLVAVDCPVPAVTRRCRVIEIAPTKILGLDSAERSLREGTRFDEMLMRNDEIVFTKDENDPDGIQLCLVMGAGSYGKFADCDIADADIPKSIDNVINNLEQNNRLLWHNIL